jgi:hypothetical protein
MARDGRKNEEKKEDMVTTDWRELCEQASKETDSQKLLQLTAEIARLLDDKQQKLGQYRS